ncbi:hypothetical protein O181_049363 [Austropuccinia psidii MF-1]|uniref:Uncharacterized protein n=1 Tax=Austropuccinia psidii MF-1 TaxID=1389203 RepID=A0A9Q3HLC4_9BASI|nr:hypothetical protein [Austropuccinia psidii MF-1]
MDVKFDTFDTELQKLTSNINERTFTEWFKVTNGRIESIPNTYDRIKSKFQQQNDELENISINNINEKLTTMKEHVLEMVGNTNLLATNSARSDSERKKLNNAIATNVNQIHKDL